ncbi:uncharacterized protein LOC117334039 [Pecten maximus]|uniref:uncharacterized protein LOC117334039 n=1 Tax=Pecten maximus TaxID=6579 RepID=UPI001458FAD7|nr:uncharacterized protein LOC117334039 [Pecten maximus]XP_033749349.1 uncharacterized protein LOC117334039 [Pecten maximus]
MMSTSSGSSHNTSYIRESRHVNTNISRAKQECDRKLIRYEKEHDGNVSKMGAREKVLRDSMLAYTERMRNIANSRQFVEPDRYSSPESLPLVVHAKHIPKFPVVKSKRKPASLDDLIGSQAEKARRIYNKPGSKLSLPALPDRLNKRTHHVKISFVSASDLYDFVDFSIRNKASKEEALNMLKNEAFSKRSMRPHGAKHRDRPDSDKATKSSDSPTPSFDDEIDSQGKIKDSYGNLAEPTVVSHSSSSNDGDRSETRSSEDSSTSGELSDSDVPALSFDALKIRPRRAKRMTLHQPQLNIIPENAIVFQKAKKKRQVSVTSPPPKQSPRNILNTVPLLSAIPEYEHSSFGDEEYWNKKKRAKALRREENQTHHGVRLEPLSHVEHPQLKTKMKAQKKIRKLIYLRDVPEKKYHRE